MIMNYKKHYKLLIEKAQNRKLNGYFEKHHIVPRCIGGTNEKSNLVELTPEEHYVAHQLLVKMYPNNDSLVYAANKMTVSSSLVKRKNKQYGWLKKKYQLVCKKRIGDKNSSFGKSWYHCPVTLKNGKFLTENVPTGWVKGRTTQQIERYCKVCQITVDIVSKKLNKDILCKVCKNNKKKKISKEQEIYSYELISKIYLEHINSNIGYYTLAQKYNVNKWTIYDYIKRYEKNLKKDFK